MSPEFPALAPEAISLARKSVMIAGDANELNQGIAARLRAAGATVVFSGETMDGGELLTREADIAKLAATIEERLGGIDCIVAGLGSGPHLRLADATFEECQHAFFCHLASHVYLMRSFKAGLARHGGSYVIVHDRSSPHFHSREGLGSTFETAELSLAKSLAAEAGGVPPYIYTLVLASDSGSRAESSWLTPANLPEAVLRIVDHPDIAKERVVIECNWRDHLEPNPVAPESVSLL